MTPCTLRLTTPTEVNAATMLINVGIMLNFPACQSIEEGCYAAIMTIKVAESEVNWIKIQVGPATHVSIDEDVEADGIGFDQRAVVSPVLRLVVLGKPGGQ